MLNCFLGFLRAGALLVARLLAFPAHFRAILLTVLLSVTFTAQAVDVTPYVSINRGGLSPNLATGTLDAAVTVTNISRTTLLGPLQLVLESATPANVALYNSNGRTPSNADYVQLPLVNGILPPGTTISVPVRLLTYGQAVAATVFSVQGNLLLPGQTAAQIAVSAVFRPETENGVGMPVGPGYNVLVDGVVRGVTGADGKLLVTVPANAKQASVSRPPGEGGSVVLPLLRPQARNPVTVVVDEGKEIAAGSIVRIEQAQQRVLVRNVSAVTLRFFENENPVLLTDVDTVMLVDVEGRQTNLTGLFSVQADGSAVALGSAFFNALAGRDGVLSLRVSGSDVNGVPHIDTVPFQLASYQVRVQLVAPPSNPSLPLAGVRITASLLNSDVRFVAQSDASGFIVLPDLPAGNLSFSGGAFDGQLFYSASGSTALLADTLVNVTLRGTSDILSDVAPISTQPLRAGAKANPRLNSVQVMPLFTPEQAAARAAKAAMLSRGVKRGISPLLLEATPTSVSVAASGRATGVIVEGRATLNVPRGTQKVNLSYRVSTEEYPQFVLAQSVYNDVWRLAVLASSGVVLFDTGRQINSQLTQPPVWQSDGSTALIREEINVAALTVSSDVSLVLRATSVNVGDDRLSTTVVASLDTEEPLRITAIQQDAIDTRNDGSFYSIPRPGATNNLQRNFDVTVNKPADATLTAVSLELIDAGGAVLETLFRDAAPGSRGVEVLSESSTSSRLRIRGTFQDLSPSIGTQPPATSNFGYRFTVKARASSGTQQQDQRDATGKRALWRMPDGFNRYSPSSVVGREPGGDDWVSRGAYLWMDANRSLLTAINDVSGEHGIDIGHKSHAQGTDIDMFHFYRFPGAISGTANYNALRNDLVIAFSTLQNPPSAASTAAYNRVAAWVIASRSGLTALVNNNQVAGVIYCSGLAGEGLSLGWCSRLLRQGTATRTVSTPNGLTTETLTFGGTFDSGKMTYNNVHDNHVHITLDRSRLAN